MNNFIEKIKRIPHIGKFFEKEFFHYTWISVFISVLNIFLLWLLIDVFDIPTIISSTLIIGGTFIIRYILYRLKNVL